jgi:hypothetical protein
MQRHIDLSFLLTAGEWGSFGILLSRKPVAGFAPGCAIPIHYRLQIDLVRCLPLVWVPVRLREQLLSRCVLVLAVSDARVRMKQIRSFTWR